MIVVHTSFLPVTSNQSSLLVLSEKRYNGQEKGPKIRSNGTQMNPKLARSLKIFFAQRKEILLAFLFGSFAKRQARPSSDVDIGVLFSTVPQMNMLNDLTDDLSSLLRKEVDLAILNDASPILKMQVLKSGILLYAKDKKYYHQFFVDTVNQYDDLKQIRRVCEENILKGRIYARNSARRS